jgi:Cyclin, N-terminal domain
MIQVFRVLGNEEGSPEALFLAISIFDRYLDVQSETGVPVKNSDLYLIGLGSIFLASKYEDARHIKIEEIFEDAGHKRFSVEEIISMERKIIIALQFRIGSSRSVYSEASLILKQALNASAEADERRPSKEAVRTFSEYQ